MNCTIPASDIDRCIAFHGHSCPGLAIGIRASEFCLQRIGHNDRIDVMAVCETDMCGVDAIQFLTGCTFGKGNLIHRDYGKTAFSFYNRDTGQGWRIVLKSDAMGPAYPESRDLMKRSVDGESTPEQDVRLDELRTLMQKHVLSIPLEDLFHVDRPRDLQPRPAKILDTLTCAACGEPVMESRIRLFDGRTLCIPCFEQVEQKI